jgi:hypothetical protein
MKERSELVEWIRAEIVGPSRPAQAAAAGFAEKVFNDPVSIRRGALTWLHSPDAEPQEVLFFDRESPHRKYGAGVLFPQDRLPADAATEAGESSDTLGTDAQPEDEQAPPPAPGPDADGDAGEEQTDDDFAVNGPDVRRPTTLGISFCVRLGPTGSLVVRLPQSKRLPWQQEDDRPFQVNGRYEQCERRWTTETGAISRAPVWRRVPAVGAGTAIPISVDRFQHGKPIPADVPLPAGSPLKLKVEVFPRHLPTQDAWLVTVVLRNMGTSDSRENERERILYQTFFEVGLEDGTFLPYPESQRPFASRDADEQSLALLYRDAATWAIGHGCAGGWDSAPEETPTLLFADVLPAVELPSMTPDVETAAGPVKLSMRELSSLSEDGSGAAWESLTLVRSAFADWINGQRARARELEPALSRVADRHLDLCSECLNRIDDGLALLRSSGRDRQAFRLANQAMLLQQISTKHIARRELSWDARGRRVLPVGPSVSPLEVLDKKQEDSSRIGSWRAFQIAFLLMSMKGLSEPTSDQRSIVDLIWFPTGGGKTEAYLAAMAYHMFRERLLMADGGDPLLRDGTNVLMRYTLRMLTTQQFQRAASLICAMERIRREPGRWGIQSMPGRRFSLGLWVGGDGSPNRISEARSAMAAYRNARSNGNPLVLTECPWCRCSIGRVAAGNGHELAGIFDHRDEGPRLLCPDSSCDFGAEDPQRWLPVEVIDERIYQSPPSLVIATADKLAMTAYRPEARALFGLEVRAGTVVRAFCPPGLIIQDELHLISGPLGTMYALYEGIFERLCSYEVNGVTVRPKIIASTATIRGAGEQVMALYGRKETRLFPSPGLSMGDSFFGRYARDPAGRLRSGRLYLGVHAPGYGSVLTTQVRAFSSALYRAARLPADRRDPWWTLLAFYNSIRELGGARTLFDSDIRSRLKYLFNREDVAQTERRNLSVVAELTSRLAQSEIVEMMDRLGVTYGRKEVVDVSLASNIIEVGVDIDRLSLMGIVGQPKTTSTYIQVSGRVGRRWQDRPGLILTVFNPGKSRDRSHFEQFHSYHRRLYERVEPTSTTPFAISALRRGLVGPMLAWARGQVESRQPRLNQHEPALREALDALIARCMLIQGSADAGRSAAEMQRLFDDLLMRWRMNPQEWERFPQSPDGEYLMLWPGQFRTARQERRGVDVPTSMRQVDASAELSITEGYTLDPRCMPTASPVNQPEGSTNG